MRRRLDWLLVLAVIAVGAIFIFGRDDDGAGKESPADWAAGDAAAITGADPVRGSADVPELRPDGRVEAPPPRIARRVLMRRTLLPDGPLRPYIDELRPRAEAGDAEAAWQLAQALYECRQVEVDPTTLEQHIERMHQTRRDQETLIEDTDLFEREMRRRYARCVEVSEAERAEYYRWLEVAARGGEIEALENFGYFLPPGDVCVEFNFDDCTAAQQQATLDARVLQLQMLDRARDAGSAAALWQLGAAYLNGELLPRNDIEAYANLRAFQIVRGEFHAEDPVAQLVRDLGERMLPVQRTIAEARAQKLVDDPDCCVMFR